ncbi:hypothetical protein PTSG_01520 [Salpingoeca rosetta]|uniref:Pescadillo homolog n=1 Tax=Salpingoeca rosetta (strain ATCC 50818 / BSB-021) TaxID=946362 RepID=F2U0K9_SALR5|nr:uncharacterized protein PTSG_01520 [Salpingoeca rosetta]EGD80937.1 hypothetical protein PTSG_01520 [Salpingoeca rosetta]|eukprot:XP_004997498.1 hypothetical protein PTSG_01520 [Salpingoeca rosetta]
MGRMKKKGQAGTAVQYMTRSAALRKLQLNLADFRRLCILKGIYPRDPANKKKLPGARAHRTYYFTKDIKYLAHEPLIDKFRELKVFSRKLQKALAKGQPGMAKSLREQEPEVKIDHIVRERYPSFVDALRDLDDCLCMIFLFANFPQHKDIQSATVTKCRRFSQEFMYYVILTRSLRKVFLSIKGIYYQAEIMGQTITWIVPYKFATEITPDIDLRVMSVFLTFYTKLMGFVNFKLFHDLALEYPPQVDEKKLKSDVGLSCLVFSAADAAAATAASKLLAEQDAQATLDEFPEQMAGGDEWVQGHEELKKKREDMKKFTHLFDGMFFFLSREVPKDALEFAIRSFGGQVSWESMGGLAPGPFEADDKRITHHIVDRPKLSTVFDGRHYVQPQWVFDCINAHQLLPTSEYKPGSILPAHLSPFASETEDDYIPPERQRQLDRLRRLEAAGKKGDDDEEEVAEIEDIEDEVEDEEDEGEYDQPQPAKKAKKISLKNLDDDEIHRQELEAELRGEDITSEIKAHAEMKKKKATKAKAQQALQEDLDKKRMMKMVMSNKRRRLYSKILSDKKKKQDRVNHLAKKRRAHDRREAEKKQQQQKQQTSNRKKKAAAAK